MTVWSQERPVGLFTSLLSRAAPRSSPLGPLIHEGHKKKVSFGQRPPNHPPSFIHLNSVWNEDVITRQEHAAAWSSATRSASLPLSR